MTLRQTHTFAELEVSPGLYDEIRHKLEQAGYQHAIREDGTIDMQGIGLTRAAEADDPEIAWGETPMVTRDMLLITGIPWKHTADELLAVCRVWTTGQREAAERWAGALHVHASDHDDVPVPPEPAHVIAIRRHPEQALLRGVAARTFGTEAGEAEHGGG